MTDLEYQDGILKSRKGDWLIAVDPISGVWFPSYERADFEPGTRFRVRYADADLDCLDCYHTSGKSVQFKREVLTALQPELMEATQ